MYHRPEIPSNEDFSTSEVLLRLKLRDMKQREDPGYEQQVVSAIGGNLAAAISRRLDQPPLLPFRENLLREKAIALTLQNPPHIEVPWVERVARLSQSLKAKRLF